MKNDKLASVCRELINQQRETVEGLDDLLNFIEVTGRTIPPIVGIVMGEAGVRYIKDLIKRNKQALTRAEEIAGGIDA